MFDLMVDVTDRFWQLRNAHTECTVLAPSALNTAPNYVVAYRVEILG